VVEHERFLRDPERELRGICEFAGLEFDAALAARAAAPLPESRYTLTPPDADKWLSNESAIRRVLPRVQATWDRLRNLQSVTEQTGTRNAG
jgi:hypothetical protein